MLFRIQIAYLSGVPSVLSSVAPCIPHATAVTPADNPDPEVMQAPAPMEIAKPIAKNKAQDAVQTAGISNHASVCHKRESQNPYGIRCGADFW